MSYTDLNAKLVEEFGNLERLCNQIYNAQHGVTCYIEDMERIYGGSSRVANWDQDLRQLKNVRHKRNNLSHGEVSFNSYWTEPEDIDFIIDFHDRILSGTDPITLHHHLNKNNNVSNKRNYTSNIPPALSNPQNYDNSSNDITGFGLFFLIIIIIVVVTIIITQT